MTFCRFLHFQPFGSLLQSYWILVRGRRAFILYCRRCLLYCCSTQTAQLDSSSSLASLFLTQRRACRHSSILRLTSGFKRRCSLCGGCTGICFHGLYLAFGYCLQAGSTRLLRSSLWKYYPTLRRGDSLRQIQQYCVKVGTLCHKATWETPELVNYV